MAQQNILSSVCVCVCVCLAFLLVYDDLSIAASIFLIEDIPLCVTLQ